MKRPPTNDGGTTIVETMVVLAILGVVAAALLGAGDVLTRNAGRQEAAVQAQEDVRVVVARITRDIRGATGMPPPAQGTYGDTLELEGVLPQPGQVVRWRVDTNGVNRAVLDQAGGAVLTSHVVLDSVDTAGIVAFRYFDADGHELELSRPAGDISRCAVRVQVTIRARVREVTFIAQDAAGVRNRVLGRPPC